MANVNDGLSAFGDKRLSGTFGWENNEIHRTVYLNDPKNQLVPLLEELFGTKDKPAPAPFCAPFDTFHAWSINFNSEKTAHDTKAQGDFGTLKSLPTMRGGMEIDITYRPMELPYSGNDTFSPITDESWDYSAQVMSLVGNNFGDNPSALVWGSLPMKKVTNLSTVLKIIPKIELVQKRIYVTELPSETDMNCIGRVNDGMVSAGRHDNHGFSRWPEGCALLTGLPTIRRWRFDGGFVAEKRIKLAINMYRDWCVDLQRVDYVTWNRLYRPGKGWDTVRLTMETNPPTMLNTLPLYQETNLTNIIGQF